MSQHRIEADDQFYRAINPIHWEKNRVKARAFKPRGNEDISVDWAKLTTPADSAKPWIKVWGVVRLGTLTAKSIRDEGLNLDPDPKPDNQAHCLISGHLLHSAGGDGVLVRQRLARTCNELGVLGPFT